MKKILVKNILKKVVAINGSPHGKNGNSIFCFHYAKKYLLNVECQIFHVASKIKKIEDNESYFNSIMDVIRSADGIFWVFPAYIFIMPSQFKRFIELIQERGAEDAFKGKYATSIMTSIHFCDDFGLNYIHGISEDLGMNYITAFSAGMNDLDKPKERERLKLFALYFKNIVENKIALARLYTPIEYKPIDYRPENLQDVQKIKSYDMLLITDAGKSDNNILKMIETFTQLMPNPVEIINLNDISIIKGCIGCGNCQFNVGQCISAEKDDYEKMIREKVKNADALILAPKIKDRYFSAKWKQMEDRRFVDNHRPLWNGKQVVYLISGPLSALPNLMQLLHVRKQINDAEIAGIVSDEYKESEQITDLIKGSINQLLWNLEKGFSFPNTFVGVGAKKIFRDFIWNYQFVFPGDHEYFKKYGFYDFPKKNRLQHWVLKKILQNKKTRNFLEKKMYTKFEEKKQAILKE